MNIILYSTEGCHLCEQAKDLYLELKLKTQLVSKDVAFDDELFSRYGSCIPVMSLQEHSRHKTKQLIDELFWPFDLEQLQNWLHKYGIN